MPFTQIKNMKYKGLIALFSIIALMSLASFALPSFATQTSSENEVARKPEKQVELYKDNWFDFVNEYWEKYSTTAKVIDVATGKSYTVQRVGGYNHADVEPIDSTNTAIMHSIYGEWQWTRRPVWVNIKGRYIAASINGMPHAYDYIPNNDMTGHTCIHFYKSRTHGTNNWDPDHRAAVEKAFESIDAFHEYLKTHKS